MGALVAWLGAPTALAINGALVLLAAGPLVLATRAQHAERTRCDAGRAG
jgi:hypothetical protein